MPSPEIECAQAALPARLRRTAEIYLDAIRHDGGWGLAPGQVSSLVNTAEVLAVLRSAAVPYSDSGVQKGLAYIVSNLEVHLNERDRGPRTRYAAYALLGLSEYAEARTRPDVLACMHFASNWLHGHNRREGGWAAEEQEDGLSLFATTQAMIALSAAQPDDPAIGQGADCLLKHALSASTWPAEAGGKYRSPALTGLAAEALFDAGRHAPARAAAKWLHENPEKWATKTEVGRSELGTSWRHMSFSIGARAVLRSEVPFYDHRMRPALLYLDSLWSERHGLWSDGEPNDHLTVRGAYAAALLYKALRASLLHIDPLDLANTLSPPATPKKGSAGLVYIDLLAVDGEIEIESPEGHQYSISLDEMAYATVKVLATTGGRPLTARKLAPLVDLKQGDIQGMVNSINVAVHQETDGKVSRLIQSAKNEYFIGMAVRHAR
jgi:hypothetical protein